MRKVLKLIVVLGVLLFATDALAQNWTTVKGEDEDGWKRVIKTDVKGRTQGVQAQNLLDSCDVVTGWTALSNDTTGIDVDLDHVEGAASLEFDKVDGTDNSLIAGCDKTLASVDIAQYMENNGYILMNLYISATTDIAYCFVRLGTDDANYNEWRVEDTALSTGWQQIRYFYYAPTSPSVGNGITATSVAYIAVGCQFDLETSTLADVRVDNLAVNSGLQTTTDMTSQASAAAVTSLVNVVKIASQPVDMNTGLAGVGTQRTTQATDDVVSISDDDNPNTPANPIYTQPTDGTNLAYIAPSTADDLSKSENGLKVEAVAKFDDGTGLDTGKIGATGAVQMEDVTVRAGENPSLGAREVKITYLGTTEPVKVGPTAVDDTAITATTGTVILGPTKTLPNGRFCVYVKNVGGGSGDDFSDVEIQDSPDGTSGWVTTNTWTSCDTLVSGAALCKVCTDDPMPWVQIKARCLTTEDTTAEAWLRQVRR